MTHGDALWGFLLAAAVVVVLAPLVARLAYRIGALDQPKERGLHDRPTPRLGGVAILTGVLVAGIVLLPLDDSAVGDQMRGILAGAVLIVAVGIVDDVVGLNPALKLLGQAGAALVPVLAGVRVETFTLPLVAHVDLGSLSIPLTVLGFIAVMNVVNFTDGVDGLAAGVCTISAATFAVIALSLDQACLEGPATCTGAGVLSAVTAGAALGFLYHNFHPASIFMGDAGSNLLGLLLAAVAIQGTIKTVAAVALVFPLVVLAVPILDGAFVVAKRIKYGRPVYAADSEHFHHRFNRIGFSQRRTVLYLYSWTLSLAALALALRFVPYSDDHGNFDAGWTAVIVGFGVLALAASAYLVYLLEIVKFRRLRERQLRRAAARGQVELSEREIDEEIAREVETGEFDTGEIKAARP